MTLKLLLGSRSPATRKAVLVAGIGGVLLVPPRPAAANQRLDFYDAAGNPLLFVSSEIDPEGRVGARNVYAPDTFFLRSTTPTYTDGVLERESSLNFDHMPAGELTYRNSGGRTSFSILDEFGEELLQGSREAAPGRPSYEIVDGQGRFIATLGYHYDEQGGVTSIDVLNSSGTITHRVEVGQGGGIGASHRSVPPARKVSFNARRMEATVVCDGPSVVRCVIHDPAGRVVAIAAERRLAAGTHRISVPGFRELRSGPGLGIVRIRAGDREHVFKTLHMGGSL